MPTGDDDYSRNWRDKIVNIITKDRIIDKSFKNQIEKRSLYTCELHYPEEQLIRNFTKTTRKPGAVPSINLPIKSISTTVAAERSTISIQKRLYSSSSSSTTISVATTSCYLSFGEFCARIGLLKLPKGWVINKKSDNLVQIYFSDDEHTIPQFEIYVNHNLIYNIRVYNWILPQEHNLVKLYNGSMKNITLSNLISAISVNSICQGITSYK